MISSIDAKYFKLAVGSNNIGKETPVDIDAKCPVCGDSQTNKRKKRLHIYVKNGLTLINCFNGDCPVSNKTVYSFIRDFFPSMFNQYKRENFSNSMSNLHNNNAIDTDVFAHLSNNLSSTHQEIKDTPVKVFDLSPYLRDINEEPNAIKYLKRRGYQYSDKKFGKWFYGYQDLKIGETLYKITNSIVIPLYYKDQMYGFYSRKIDSKTFYSFNQDVNIGYKVWNFFNVDFEAPVYIYEGIFDAISSSIQNSIALMGAKLPEPRLSEIKNPVFVLDNDRTGIVNSIEYAKRGYNVYVQPNKYPQKDINDLMLKNPDLDIQSLINENIYSGISAIVRLKSKI